jgi:hypothetical protein
MFDLVLAINQTPPMISGMNSTKAKKFWSKKAAIAAVEECQRSGWACGIIGIRAPFIVQAVSSREAEASTGFSVKYDLHTDGKFHEYSRKEVAA